MKTLTLTQEKEKLSGETFFKVKAGLMIAPLENHVACNFLYHTKDGKLIPSYIYISPKENNIDSGWSILDGHTEAISMNEGDIFVTPFGNYELYDSPKTLFKVGFRPYEYITDYITENK